MIPDASYIGNWAIFWEGELAKYFRVQAHSQDVRIPKPWPQDRGPMCEGVEMCEGVVQPLPPPPHINFVTTDTHTHTYFKLPRGWNSSTKEVEALKTEVRKKTWSKNAKATGNDTKPGMRTKFIGKCVQRREMQHHLRNVHGRETWKPFRDTNLAPDYEATDRESSIWKC